MLQQDEPEDFVIATGEVAQRARAVDVAFARVGLDPAGTSGSTSATCRPAEVEHLVGDASKAQARSSAGSPQTSFEEMIRRMVDADLELLGRGVPQKQAG